MEHAIGFINEMMYSLDMSIQGMVSMLQKIQTIG